MMKTALRRGGRLIAVTALATAFLGSTAGAMEPVPEAPPVQKTVSLQDCKTVAVTRDAGINYNLNTSRGTQAASATAHGDASVRVCYDLQVTVGATVNVNVQAAANAEGDAQQFATASAESATAAESDTEHVCASAGVVLGAGANAGANATGNVAVAVVANASASGDTSVQDATVENQTVGTTLLAPVDATVPAAQGVNEFANTKVCVDSKGTASVS